MNNLRIFVALTCIVLVLAGCSGTQHSTTISDPSSSNSATTTLPHSTQNSENSTSKETIAPTTITRTDHTHTPSDNGSVEYTNQFEHLVENDSLNVSSLNNPYKGGKYDGVKLDIRNIQIKHIPPDDQNILVISQNVSDPTVSELRRTLGKISIVFATVMKREATNDEGDWNVSQARILTYHNDSLKLKNRISIGWVNGWVFQLLDWDTSGYVEGRVLVSSAEYNTEVGGFPSKYSDSLESKVEIESVNSNISRVHVNQSGRLIFLTYTTTTPPSQTHMEDHISEYVTILREYGEIAKTNDFGSYNRTTLYFEEVYAAPNGTYDTQRVYTVNSTFAIDVYNNNLTLQEIATHLINRAVFEDDAFYE